MIEQRSPLARVLDGPGLLMQRLTEIVTPRLQGMDTESLMFAMAESDPDYLTYLDSEGLLWRKPRKGSEEESYRS